MTLLDCARCKAAFPREVLPQGPASTCPVLSQNSAWLDVHRSVRFGSRPYCSLFGRDSTISRLLLIDGLKPRSSFGTPRPSGYEYVAEIHTTLKYLNLLDFQHTHPCHAWAFRLGVVTNCAQDKRRA